MEISQVKWLVSKMPGLRLTDPEVERIEADYEEITGTSEPVDFRKFFWALYDVAISRIAKVKEKRVELVKDPEQEKHLQQLTDKISELQKQIEEKEDTIAVLKASADTFKELNEEFDVYLVCASKETNGKISTLHDFFSALLSGYQKHGRFVITAQDQAYYDSVKAGNG